MSRDFGDRQQQYYLSELNRIIPVSAKVGSQDTIQAALAVTDPELPAGSWTTRSPLFSEFESNKTVLDRDQACRNIPYPGEGMRKTEDRVGCGWWFPDDMTKSSIGAYGSRRGAASQPILEKAVGTGQWIWDPAAAYAAEVIKQTKPIQSCQQFQATPFSIPNVAWCTTDYDTGRGAAFVTTGPNQRAVGFPRQFECPPDQVTLRGEMCPPPSQGPGAPPIPPYAQPDFCIDGALSPACVSFLRERVCPGGSLGRQLATGSYGLNAADGKTPITQANGNDVQKIQAAVNALTGAGIYVDPGILYNGQSTQANVNNSFNAIKSMALRGDGSLASRAALSLCYDGFSFSGCPGNSSDPGPFVKDATDETGASCIQNAALSLGYSSNGAMIQLDTIKNNFQNWNQFQNWGELLTALMGYKQSADSSSTPYTDRKTYLNNVYGIQLQDPLYGCNFNGVYMYRYYFTPNINPTTYIFGGSNNDQPQTHFLGRYNWKNGFPQVLVSTGPQAPAGNYKYEAQVFVTQIQIPANGDGTYQFVLASNFQARVEYGSNPAITTTVNTPTIVGGGTYTEGMRIPLRIIFYGFLPNWGFSLMYTYNGSALTAIQPQLLLLPKSTKNPMFEIAVSDGTDPTGTIPKGTIGETTGLVSNIYANGLTVGTVGGKQAMVVSGGISCALNTLTSSQGIRGRAFRSITTTIYVSQVTGIPGPDTPGLGIFMMYNLPSSAGYLPTLDPCGNYVIQDAGSPTPRSGTPQESWDYSNRKQDMGLYLANGGSQIMFSCKGWPGAANLTPISIKLNTWYHIALVWDDDWNGIKIYINGNNIQAQDASIPCVGPRGPMIFEQFRAGCDETAPNGWTGGMGWFRGFDYRMSQTDIQTDMQNKWTLNSS